MILENHVLDASGTYFRWIALAWDFILLIHGLHITCLGNVIKFVPGCVVHPIACTMVLNLNLHSVKRYSDTVCLVFTGC